MSSGILYEYDGIAYCGCDRICGGGMLSEDNLEGTMCRYSDGDSFTEPDTEYFSSYAGRESPGAADC